MNKQVNYLDYLKTKDKKWNIILIAVLIIAIGLLGRYLVVIGIIILVVILLIRFKEKKDKGEIKK